MKPNEQADNLERERKKLDSKPIQQQDHAQPCFR